MPLYRLYGSPKTVDVQIHGTGLGLAVAKRIAEAREGSLSVTSEVGVGSTRTLHLPVPRAVGCRNGSVTSGIELGVQK